MFDLILLSVTFCYFIYIRHIHHSNATVQLTAHSHPNGIAKQSLSHAGMFHRMHIKY